MIPASRLIMLVMILAAVLRLWGIGFGLPLTTARPDEIQIAGPAVGYLSGDLRPPFFQWPALFQYTVAVAYAVYAVVGRPVTGFTSIAAFAESRRQSLVPFLYIPRLLSAMLGVATIWLVYRLARRLCDETVGVVAALFLAVSLLHVRDSHFGVSDVPMTALLMAGVLLTLLWQDRGGVWLALAAGVVTGLAGATKYNALGAVVAFGVACVTRTLDSHRETPSTLSTLLIPLGAYTLGVTAAFFGTSPYVVIDWSRFITDVSEVQSTLANGPAGIRVGRGWWYFARVVLPVALGWPMFVLGVAGAAGMLAREWRRAATVLAFPVAYYLFAGRGYGVFARHALPMVPFLCITAAWTTVQLTRFFFGARHDSVSRGGTERTPDARTPGSRLTPGFVGQARAQTVALAVAAVIASFPAWASIQLDRLLSADDNRLVTARALLEVIPARSTFGQTGESYGHVPLGFEGRQLDVRVVLFDKNVQAFTPGAPEWVLVQRSPLAYYSAVPSSYEAVLRSDYDVVHDFRTGADNAKGRVYDQQDAFYLPLSGFANIVRPGPSFELYHKRPTP